MTLRPFVFLIALSFVVLIVCPERSAAERMREDGVAVIEVFTSSNSRQVEDSARTVKALEEERLAGRQVLALAYHVDYVDAPASKDVFAKLAFRERQKQHGHHMHRSEIAVDEAFVNGQYFARATNLAEVRKQAWKALAVRPRAQIKAKLTKVGSDVASVDYSVIGLEKIRRDFFYLHIALLQDEPSGYLASGPNQGKKVGFVNLVRSFESARFTPGGSGGSVDISIPPDTSGRAPKIICFVQDPQNNRIIGATVLSFDNAKSHE